jgi:hypothetical protein
LIDVIAEHFPKRVIENVCCGVVVAQWPSSELVITRQNFVPNVELTVFQMPDVKNISVENLNVSHLEVCDAIDDNIAGIIFLSTRFCVETRAVEKNAECRIIGQTGR